MPMLNAAEELTRYDLTRDRLREALSDHIPDTAILDNAVTTYAYWVCTSLNQEGSDWEQVLEEYTEMAVPCSDDEWEGECREVELIQRELQGVQGPVLDVGAGWGRLAPLYRQLGLPAAYIEPVSLGVRLMHRDGLARVVQCPGEALPFATNSFAAVVIGWVLHHRATPNVDPDAILSQAARVTIPDADS